MCVYVRDALPRHLDVPRSLCAAVEQRCARRLLFVSTLGAPHPMDWEPVPALTLPSAALTARGADHDLYFAAGDSVEVALGVALSLCQSEMWSVAEGVFATRRLPGASAHISTPTTPWCSRTSFAAPFPAPQNCGPCGCISSVSVHCGYP